MRFGRMKAVFTVALGLANTTSLVAQSAQLGLAHSREHLAMGSFQFEKNLIALQSAGTTPRPAKMHMDMPHTLAATYYSLQDGFEATLILSNQGPHPMDVSVTLFSLSGERLSIPPVTIPGTTVREFSLRKWIESASHLFAEGSVQVSYSGMNMELGGVLKFEDVLHSLIFDEELAENDVRLCSSGGNVVAAIGTRANARCVVKYDGIFRHSCRLYYRIKKRRKRT